ncbi:MAG: hypothetical protein DHS20C16_08010 [Phycisphaerae bacterium]|nr:MAG: hypothetical protein DHS20C16_08010 [Phycisphaerae bacterium]
MDQNSTNGLFVNNQQIQSHELCSGDRLTVGEFTLTFVASDSEAGASGLAGAAAIASGHESFGEFELEQTTATPSVDGENLTFMDDDLNTRPTSTPTDSELKCPRCSEHLDASANICVHCGHDLKSGRRIAPASIEESDSSRKGKLAHVGGIGSYLKSCAGSAIFVADAGNFISFIFVMILAAMNAGVDMLTFTCLMWIPYIIIKGLLAAFFFNVVINASSGDTDLPDIGLSGDMYEDMIAPFFKMVATSLIVMSPLYVYMFSVGITQVTTLGIAVTLGIGVFFWPITMLVIALGGVSCFARPDQVLLTVFRTFVPYLVTCSVLAIAIGMTWVLEFAMESATAALGGNQWAVATILWIVNVYCFIVAMQCIGLYYHHFKDRFAWSWG